MFNPLPPYFIEQPVEAEQEKAIAADDKHHDVEDSLLLLEKEREGESESVAASGRHARFCFISESFLISGSS